MESLDVLLLYVATACVAVAVTAIMFFRKRSSKPKRLPPGEMPWPIGNIKLFKDGFRNICSYEGAGPRKTRLVLMPMILLRQLEHIKMVLTASEDTISSFWPPATKYLLGSNSFAMATGAYHRMMRRLVGPCLSVQAIESYYPAIQALCERYCTEWAAATTAAKTTADLPKFVAGARLLTFEIMAHVVAGFKFTPAQLTTLSSAFDDFMKGLFSPLPLSIPGTLFAKATTARQVVLAAVNKQLDGLQAEGAAASDTAGVGSSIMQRLMGAVGDDGKPFSRAVFQDITVNLLFAGHETTATSLIQLFVYLRSRPDVVQRLRSEQQQAVERHGDQVTGAALRDMPYLDSVVKELMRLEAVVPILFRMAEQDLVINGYDVPKGWQITLGLTEPLRDHPTWRGVPEDDPLHPRHFNPDRWQVAPPPAASAHDNDSDKDESNESKLPPGVLSSPMGMLPHQMFNFGGGSHYCLGFNLAWAEMKTFLCVFFRRYHFSCPLESLSVKAFPAIDVTQGFPIKVLAAETAASP